MITTPNLLSPGRRQFLQQSCAGIAALTVLGNPLQALAASQSSSDAVKKTGLQLYTLRDMMEKSVADTLKLVAGVGYGDVEFAGYFGHSAADIRKLLDANGLAAPSVHVPLEVLRSALPQVIKDAKVYLWPKLEERVEVLDTWPMMRPYPYPYYWGYGPGIRVRTVTKPHSTTQGPVHVDNNKQNKVQP